MSDQVDALSLVEAAVGAALDGAGDLAQDRAMSVLSSHGVTEPLRGVAEAAIAIAVQEIQRAVVGALNRSRLIIVEGSAPVDITIRP